jgi:hypothetical protein
VIPLSVRFYRHRRVGDPAGGHFCAGFQPPLPGLYRSKASHPAGSVRGGRGIPGAAAAAAPVSPAQGGSEGCGGRAAAFDRVQAYQQFRPDRLDGREVNVQLRPLWQQELSGDL